MTGPFDPPPEMRDFAERSIAQARKAFEGFMGAVQKGADAIAREDWPALTLIARKLAEHPAPPATEKVRILTALGNDAARFRELEHQTHHAANEMGEAAKKADGRLVIEAYAKVQSACLACHQGFLSRVRQAIDAPFVKKP